MLMKVGKITALVCGVLVTLLFIVLLIMVTRPALLTGVSGDYLSNSVNGSDGGQACRKLEGGDWRCTSGSGRAFRVEVDWMGCWKIKPKREIPDDPMSEGPGEHSTKGCIELGDVVTFD
jgi:hypothetical protein